MLLHRLISRNRENVTGLYLLSTGTRTVQKEQSAQKGRLLFTSDHGGVFISPENDEQVK